MADTTSLAKGIAIKKDGKMYFVTETFFVSPGKGSAFFRTKLKEIQSGKIIEHTFKSGESIELLDTSRKNASFLYKQGKNFFFMDDKSYEQYEVDESEIDKNVLSFLKEGLKCILLFAEDNLLGVTIQQTKVSYEVTDAPPAIKGDTVSNVYRTITIETGAKIQAPMFIKQGDNIIINVEKGEYDGRGKK